MQIHCVNKLCSVEMSWYFVSMRIKAIRQHLFLESFKMFCLDASILRSTPSPTREIVLCNCIGIHSESSECQQLSCELSSERE